MRVEILVRKEWAPVSLPATLVPLRACLRALISIGYHMGVSLQRLLVNETGRVVLLTYMYVLLLCAFLQTAPEKRFRSLDAYESKDGGK